MYRYSYVKAPLRVMYGKYSTRGGVEWQIQEDQLKQLTGSIEDQVTGSIEDTVTYSS